MYIDSNYKERRKINKTIFVDSIYLFAMVAMPPIVYFKYIL